MEIDPKQFARRIRSIYPRHVVNAVADAPPPPNHSAGEPDPVPPELAKYRHDPVGFFRDILGVSPTVDQCKIARAVPGNRVKIESGHTTGKSWLMGGIALWWFYTRNPSVIICNAPTSRAVEDVLWTEIRLLHMRSKYRLPNHFVGPKAPEMYDTPDHWAKGYTTSRGESYQGRHRDSMLFLFDEDEGIDPIFWTTTNTMYQPDGTHAWVAACNPITTSSQSFLESTMTAPDGSPKWDLYTLSSLDHPNVLAELRGEKPPVPNAVGLEQVKQWVKDWTTPLDDPDDHQDGDVEWPPATNKWVRPGPTFKARAMGLRPSEGVDTVFGVKTWELMCRARWNPHDCWVRACGITIGVDGAGYGDDDLGLHVRTGPLSLHHEAHNGWEPGKSAGRIKELSRVWSAWYNTLADFARPPLVPTDVNVTIEQDGGYGLAILTHQQEYHRWHGVTVGAGSTMIDSTGGKMYANVRAEMWCEAARKAKEGLIDVSRLEPDAKERLRKQLLSVTYENKPDGSKLVEAKKDIKERTGRSPDDADSLLLCHYTGPSWETTLVGRDDSE